MLLGIEYWLLLAGVRLSYFAHYLYSYSELNPVRYSSCSEEIGEDVSLDTPFFKDVDRRSARLASSSFSRRGWGRGFRGWEEGFLFSSCQIFLLLSNLTHAL